jgi:hypothetical protein
VQQHRPTRRPDRRPESRPGGWRPGPRLSRAVVALVTAAASVGALAATVPDSAALAVDTRVPAGQVLRISVPDAIGGKTVIGQLTVDNASTQGYVTAYGCDNGIPRDAGGGISKSDLNYDGTVTKVWSNRLIVQADADGDICLYTYGSVDMIVDVNGVSFDTGINSFPNQRTDTRTGVNTPKQRLAAGGTLRVAVPQAVGAKTVVGQLTIVGAADPGYITAYGCNTGTPRGPGGEPAKSDLNFDGRLGSARSNRLIVQADANGDICLFSTRTIDVIVDINAVADRAITSFTNRRIDTRNTTTGSLAPTVAAGQVLRISVPEAVGAKTVIGQLTVDRTSAPGFVTAYGCNSGISGGAGGDAKSDLNFDGRVVPVWSNRLIVQADANGDICLVASAAATDLIVDVNAVASDIGIFSFPNQRTDTRSGTRPPVTSVPADAFGVPVWPPFTPRPAAPGVSALTGAPVDAATANRPIVAVKIDNFRRARPQFGLERADVIIEQNAEGITRLVALFHTQLPTDVGPVRSARTSDVDLLGGMNRPVLGYSGANAGVTSWIRSAASSGVLVDFSALSSPCYRRDPDRPAPHNLLLDASCANAAATSGAPGPAGALWSIDGSWTPPGGVRATPDTAFRVRMDGVRVDWTWNPITGVYQRSQDGAEHVAASGAPIVARNVVEIAATHVPSVVDARSPHPITVGSGAAVIHRSGVAIAGTWSRATATDPFVFRDAATGNVVPLDIGITFVQLTRAG